MRSPGEYSAVLRQRGAIRGSCFDLHVAFSSDRPPRLGLVVGKRQARKAVLRTLIKRQLREVFRCRCASLPNGDYVVRLAKPLNTEDRLGLKKKIRDEVQALFDRAQARSGS